MSRYRLRYLHHDLELADGEFAVGRNASCQLSLDDPLVSRRHALIIVSGQQVTVQDLGSRNGVLVNGEKIDGAVPIGNGDRILIGAQEMTVVEGPVAAAMPRRSHPLNRTMPKLPVSSPHEPRSEENPKPPVITHLPGTRSTSPPNKSSSTSSSPPDRDSTDVSMVRRQDAFSLLTGVADKALAMGRVAEAERILASPLADVIEASRSGKKLTSDLVDQAARFSAKLATATGKSTWADYVIELYAAQKRPCPAVVIDELYTAMRRVTTMDLPRLRELIEVLKRDINSFGPGDRFLIQRLEGLERVVAFK
ncbi:MAG: FHA domain-containing protein [Polyangiaceae bacterium]